MSDVGSVEYPTENILPNRPMSLGNGDGTALAGEVVASGPFFGLLQDNASNGDVRGLVVHAVMRIRKTTAAIADNDPLTFVANPTGTKNDVWVRKAVAGEAIHAYALELAAQDTTDILVVGPLVPPYALVGEAGGDAFAAALLATVTGATAGQILVADGANDVELTDYAVPTADGALNEILKTDGAAAVTWQADVAT